MQGKFVNFLILIAVLFNVLYFYKSHVSPRWEKFTLKKTDLEKSPFIKKYHSGLTAVFKEKDSIVEFFNRNFEYDNLSLKEIYWKNKSVFVKLNIDE